MSSLPLPLFLRVLACIAILFVTTTTTVVVAADKKCPHGETTNDIATSSNLDLTGKVALVTGGRSGLGYAISEALLSRGCAVVIASRNETLNKQAVMDLQQSNSTNGSNVPDVSYMTFDLESFESIRSFAASFEERSSQRLDYYFGNAGQGSIKPEPLTEDGYERIFQVNYVGQVLLLELLLPLLRKSQPSRIILTASSTHEMACGTLGLDVDCWGGDDAGNSPAIATLPYDRAGLEAINSTFDCRIGGTYPVTKFLMTQLARSVAEQEAESGNEVVAYSFAPGNIHTTLNPFGSCCGGDSAAAAAAINNMGNSTGPAQCTIAMPYVGPTDAEGNPDPPTSPELNHWSSPKHGSMAAVYEALIGKTEDTGSFSATYWECETEKGYFPQGVTAQTRDEIYRLSKSWAGLDQNVGQDTANSGGGMEEIADPVDQNAEQDTPTSGGSTIYCCFWLTMSMAFSLTRMMVFVG